MQGGAGPVTAGARTAGGSGVGATAACGWAFPHHAFPSALRYHPPPSTFALLTNERTCLPPPAPIPLLRGPPTHPPLATVSCWSAVARVVRQLCSPSVPAWSGVLREAVRAAILDLPRLVDDLGLIPASASSDDPAAAAAHITSPAFHRYPPPPTTTTWGGVVSHLTSLTHHPLPLPLPPARRLWQAFGALSVVGGPRGLAPGAHVRLREPDGVDSIAAPEVAPPPTTAMDLLCRVCVCVC